MVIVLVIAIFIIVVDRVLYSTHVLQQNHTVQQNDAQEQQLQDSRLDESTNFEVSMSQTQNTIDSVNFVAVTGQPYGRK